MCFYNDSYDWYAEVHEVTDSDSGDPCRCEDCGKVLASGDWRRSLFQQESESQCLTCEGTGDIRPCESCVEDMNSDPKCPRCHCWSSEVCFCDAPNYGNTYSAAVCRTCCAMRAAIRRQERDEGCPVDSQVPERGELELAFTEHCQHETYAARVVRLFPSLRDHKFIKISEGRHELQQL